MSHLQKIRQNNLKSFQKAAAFLTSKGFDMENLPKIQTKKPSIQINPRIPNNAQQSRVIKTQNDDSDSEEYAMIAYIISKRQKEKTNNQSNKQQSDQYQNKQSKGKASNIDLSEYSYQSNYENQQMDLFQNIRPDYKQKKPLKQKQIKSNPKWKLINKDEYAKKVKIDQVIKNFEPLKCNYQTANNQYWANYKKHEDHRLYYILSKFPKIKEFKNNQKAIIKCGLENHDIFVCMPTGGGKSLTFQILTFLIKGVFLCILPLISLIFDQQYQAKMLGIQAYSLTANTSQSEVKMVYSKLNNFEDSQKSVVIFCTPQKLNLSPAFSQILDRLYHQNFLKRVIIDQVHCVSTWGKQFRAEYQNLSSLKRKFPKTPILALTATVTEVVKQDIIAKLGIIDCYFFQSSFNRPNLYYQVKNKDKNIFPQIEDIINKFRNKSGIIYCLSRKTCEQVSQKLNERGYRTAFYHADIDEQMKKSIQDSWMNNQINIIVATVAFGMGINKPDVRFVIHHSMSKSLENYYQESGRAGRDGQYSECILFYRKLDKQSFMNMNLKNDFSTKESKEFSTKQLAQMIKYCQDKTTCRRQFQLRYLGQTDFNPEKCNKTCDNCKKGKHYLDYECIEQAKMIIKTLLVMQDLKISVTKNQFISIIRNKIQKNKNLKYKLMQINRGGINLQELYSSFQGWKIDQIQNLMLQFMSYDLITEKIVQNQVFKNKTENSFSNVYLKCHAPRCKIFLEQVETLAIKRQASLRHFQDKYAEESQIQNVENDSLDKENDDDYEGIVLPVTYMNIQSDAERQEKIRKIIDICFDQDDD